MDDTSYMDTSSDDEFDSNLPLSVRIQMRQTATKGADIFLRSPRSHHLKDNDSSSNPAVSEGIAGKFRERGSPLSEVSSNVASGPSLILRKPPDKSKWSSRLIEKRKSDGKSASESAVRTSDGESCKQRADDRNVRRPVSSKCIKKQDGYSSVGTRDGASSSISIHEDEESRTKVDPTSPQRYVKPFSISADVGKFSHNSSSSPAHAENGKRLVTSFESPGSKSFSLRLSLPPKGASEDLSHSPTSASERNRKSSSAESKALSGSPSKTSSPSSVHISWDRSGKRLYTPLDSPRLGSSRSDASPSRTPKRSPYSVISSKLETLSPILIPDTPGSSGSHRLHDRKSHTHSSDLYRRDEVRNFWTKSESPRRKRDALLNNLLEDNSSGSNKSPTFGRSEKSSNRHNANRRSSTSSKFSSLPLSSPNASTSPRKYSLSPVNRRLSGGFERHSHANYSPHQRKDPVWDFAEERSDPSRDITSGSVSESRPRSPTKEESLPRHGRESLLFRPPLTSEDDDVPLSTLKLKYHNTGHGRSSTPILPKSLSNNAGSSVVSPSRRWTSPDKRDSLSPLFSRKKTSPSKRGVISPLKFHPVSRSWMSASQRDNEKQESSGKDMSKKEGKNKHNLHHAKRMRQLFGFSSSDEEGEDDNHDSRKRKGETPSLSFGDTSDTTSKRRKTSPPNSEPHDRNSLYHSINSGPDSERSASNVSGSRDLNLQKPHSSLAYDRRHSPGYGHESPEIPGPSTLPHRHSKSKETLASENSSTTDGLHRKSRSKKRSPPASDSATGILHSTFSSVGTSESRGKDSKKKSKGKGKKVSPPSTVASVPSEGVAAASSISNDSGRNANRSLIESSWRDSPDMPSSTTAHSSHVTVNIDSDDDDVVVLDTFSYAASLVDSYSKKRKSRKKSKTRSRSPGSTSRGATGGGARERDAVSPATLERFNQLDEDEAFARRLQEEFDAEMARSVHQESQRLEENRQEAPTSSTMPEVAERADPVSINPRARGAGFQPISPPRSIPAPVTAVAPVQIGNVNLDWNVDFHPASSLIQGLPDLPEMPPHPPLPPLPRRRGNHGRRRGGERQADDHWMMRVIQDIDQRYYRMDNQYVPAMEDLLMPIPARQRRGRGRGRGRRNNPADRPDSNAGGNDYDALLQLAERLGPAVDKRLTQSSIDRLPTFNYRGEDHHGNDDEKSCPICMDDYEDGTELRRLPCFHGYHKNCIDVWLKKSQEPVCPICRVEVKIE